MPDRDLPVRPDLNQLRHQAKDLLRALHRGDPSAVADFQKHHPERIDPATAQLADAQLVLARSYGAASWTRIVVACRLIDAIWREDADMVEQLVQQHPYLLHEHATIRDSNWGPPLSYAANLGRDKIIRVLHRLGAQDLTWALGRAVLQSKIATGRMLHEMLGSPAPPDGALGGPAYTLSVSGTAFLLEIGAKVVDAHGQRLAPVDVVLETDSRKPQSKHEILEMYAQHGLELPDTPPMALHRGRIDMIEAHLRRDPHLLDRTFPFSDIYPPSLGCHDELLAVHGTPLKGTALLQMAIDYDEWDIATWLLDKGANPNARAAVDADGFGGHTPLFNAVVSQPNFWINYSGHADIARYTKLLLERGADPSLRASLRKQLGPGYDDPRVTICREVTALEWGQRFHNTLWVSAESLRLLG